jgi:hypothetical protein
LNQSIIFLQLTLLAQPYGVFVSNGTQGGGQVRQLSHFNSAASIHLTALQEAAIFGSLANFTHHGMIYVPIGYRCAASSLAYGIGASLSRLVV